MKCELELFVGGRWQPAAVLQVEESTLRQGYRGRSSLAYLDQYAELNIGARDYRAVSCNFEVGFEYHALDHWPAFVLDLLPSGAARRHWLHALGLQDGPTADWQLLVAGAGNPPGNLRVVEAAQSMTYNEQPHSGFSRRDILQRKEGFIEYAYQHGAPVAGSTGAQGDAPKFLLTEDVNGNWHADGALCDRYAARHWLVKFPRGRHETDRIILQCEATYLLCAKEVGIRVSGLAHFEDDVLFVPRFDRIVRAKHAATADEQANEVLRAGMESLCSLAGVAEFGAFVSQERLCQAIAQVCDDPHSELLEFVKRDVLNVALKNTDNHSHNATVLKTPDGKLELTPLFDFAPMFLDREGIPRICRWRTAEEGGVPQWERVIETLEPLGLKLDPARTELVTLARDLGRLPDLLAEHRVPDVVFKSVLSSIAETAKQLAKLI